MRHNLLSLWVASLSWLPHLVHPLCRLQLYLLISVPVKPKSVPSAPPLLELEAAGPHMVILFARGGGQEEHSSFCELTRDTQGPEDACKKPGRLKASIGRIRELLCTAYVYQEWRIHPLHKKESLQQTCPLPWLKGVNMRRKTHNNVGLLKKNQRGQCLKKSATRISLLFP